MMLKPFRIRGLPSSSGGDARLGQAVQLSAFQYDSTINSNPAAALTYLDEDDGETITVGSSFELEQRLEDPVPSNLNAHSSATFLCAPHDLLHTFDVQSHPDTIMTWSQYQIPGNDEHAAVSPQQTVPANEDNFDKVVANALRGLETHVQSFAQFLQEASATLREAAEQTRESTAIDGILLGFNEIFSEVGKVGQAMVKAFEGNGLPATVAPVTASVEIPVDIPAIPTDQGTEDDASTSSDPAKWYRDGCQQASEAPRTFYYEPDRPNLAAAQVLPTPRQESVISAAAEVSKEDLRPSSIAHLTLSGEMWTDSIRGPKSTQAGSSRRADPLPTSVTVDESLARSNTTLRNIQRPTPVSEFFRRDIPVYSSPNLALTRESAKAFAHRTVIPQSRSILDQEDSDPDFAARFPSLMSLERTIGTSNPVPHAPEPRVASSHKLPGAWPEQRPDVDENTLPTSEESSGAFFDRMLRNRERIQSNPFMRSGVELPMLQTRPSVSFNPVGTTLGRSKTVTASNPAARLTRPFDPFVPDSRDAQHRNGVLRRSGTERHRRRPYAERFTGAGRMPWESFEAITQPRRLGAMRSEPFLDARARQQEQEVQQEQQQQPQSLRTDNNGWSSEIDRCVGQLKAMGYGEDKETDPQRLEICAVACEGRVEEAVEMLEDDKKAHARYEGGDSSTPHPVPLRR